MYFLYSDLFKKDIVDPYAIFVNLNILKVICEWYIVDICIF